MTDIWSNLQQEPPDSILIDGVTLRRGSRVVLHPNANGDILDRMLDGRVAVVEGFDQNTDDDIHVAVTLIDDPGRDFGEGRYPGHRFFFTTGEVEPIDSVAVSEVKAPRVLVAGIGNIFLGDDAFGVAVAQRLAVRELEQGVDVRDFGIRGMDLAYALQNDYDAVVFIDAAPRGHEPGTLSVIDARVDADGPLAIDTHGMDPVKVLAMARALGRVPSRVLVVACEPQTVPVADDWDDMRMALSEPVEQAIDGAVALVESVVTSLMKELTRRN